ncbi:MAG: peptidylprolyl isomerase [Rhodoferax sp.]|nr:peptidylprolyl isomerase [Rhodoferax sp.]
MLSRAQTVQQIGTNLYVRRVMAENASKQGLDKATEVQSALAVARDKILSDAYLAQMDKKNTVSTSALEAQARAIYQANPDRFKTPDQIRIRHILVDSKEPGARTKAEGLLAQLRSGADFVELAKANSIDQGTASKGGDLGFFARGRMLPEFESAAFAMVKPGEFSPIVETKFGFHILQLEEKRAAGIQPFAEVKDGLVKEIQTKVTQDARVAEAQAIVESAKINSAAIEAYSKSFPTSGK